MGLSAAEKCRAGRGGNHSFVSSRCVVKIKDEKSEKKIVRWNKILSGMRAVQALYTGAAAVAWLHSSQLSQIDADLRLIAYEDADCKSERLCEVLRAHPSPRRVLMVVGSEGGFSADEVETLCASGFHRVSLGGRIISGNCGDLAAEFREFYYDMAGEKNEDDI